MGYFVWIQNADHSLAVEEAATDAEQVLGLFDGYDWASQTALFAADDTGDACPPALGITDEAGGLLQLSPSADGKMDMIWTYKEPRKILGFIPLAKHMMRERKDAKRSICAESITRFLRGDTDWLNVNFPEN